MSEEVAVALVSGVSLLLAVGIVGLGLYLGNKEVDRLWDEAMGRRPKKERKP